MQVRFIDALEPRRHFDVTVAYDGRVMTVVGTEAGDRIEFTNRERTTLRVFDTSAGDGKPVDLGTYVSPKLVRVFGRGGDDGIIVSPRLRGITRFSLDGGDGNDALGGSPRDDTLFGGRGDDRLAGAAGNDYLDGSAGDDYLEDTRGVNVFHGGGGFDGALTDNEPLGTGVETQGYRRRTASGGVPAVFRTNVIRRDGRLILQYTDQQAGGGDRFGFEPLARRRDGSFELGYTYTSIGGGAIIFPVESEADITPALGRALYFSYNIDDAGSDRAFRVPLFLRI
jgi:hypothetical protein